MLMLNLLYPNRAVHCDIAYLNFNFSFTKSDGNEKKKNKLALHADAKLVIQKLRNALWYSISGFYLWI